ncbi:hypothetical protein ACFPMF_18925 [Larkinella bovis]|uniref:DUF4138 domain-containing protein n=1 Tax=Larkinella bovis TaxID=683041 RepID=A0ABW0ID52_9BACT
MKPRQYHYSFTNHFEYAGLKSRIQMMNSTPSGAGWWRYFLLWIVTVGLVMACQNWRQEERAVVAPPSIPLSNPTRVMVDNLESSVHWGRLLTYHQTKSKRKAESVLQYGEPFILGLKDGVLTLTEPYREQTLVYLNGKEASADLLANLKVDYIEELFVLHQFEGADEYDPKPYRVLLQISDQPIAFLPGRQELVNLLEAAILSDHPLGASNTFTMNKVLEATFFGYKNVFVKRLKNQHLKVQDEFINDIDVYINGLPVAVKEVETVHVREIDRLYTRERPYTAWLRAGKREARYVLYIQTAPKRARRDSSYYVFSPFYSGDF